MLAPFPYFFYRFFQIGLNILYAYLIIKRAVAIFEGASLYTVLKEYQCKSIIKV